MESYSKRIDVAVVIHSKNMKVNGKILYIPIYTALLI